jgi:hypothetical protein
MEYICQNRKNFIELLEKRSRGLIDGYRQNIAVIGDELVGKTTLITRFLQRLDNNRLIPVYLEARPESVSSFARRFMAVLLYSFLVNSQIPLKEDLEFLILKSEKYIPQTTQQIKNILTALNKRKKNNIFSELLALPETIYQETNKSCIVIFDEFQNLEKLEQAGIYREWSKTLIAQKNTMYVIVSSQKFKTKTILSKDLSLLFGNFEVANIEPFTIKATEEYLQKYLGDLNLPKGLKDFIIHFTGGFPFYLNLLTEEINKSPNLPIGDILEKLLFEPAGILNQKFSVFIKRFIDLAASKDYLDIINLIASGHNKIKDISHLLKKPAADLNKRAAFLLENDIVSRNADFLKLNDRVFGFWMSYVYHQKQSSLVYDLDSQRNRFKENTELIINKFLQQSDKPVLERISELLKHFEDETIQIDKKKIKLNHFREIKSLELSNSGIKEYLLGRSNQGIWIVAFKNESLTENDITDFSRECRKYRSKLEKKIIVTHHDIDANARLRALDEKIWAMDLNGLNQIFDLFDMPRVI